MPYYSPSGPITVTPPHFSIYQEPHIPDEQAEKSITRPTKKKRPAYASMIELSGQCAFCKDIFTILAFHQDGQYKVQETPRLQYVGEGEARKLIHRPDVCNAAVTIFGSPEQLLPKRG